MMSNKFLVLGIFVLLQLFNTLPAQTYEEWIQKSCDCIDKNDWMAAEEALKNAMREEPGNPANFALLCNLGTVQRRQGKKRGGCGFIYSSFGPSPAQFDYIREPGFSLY